MEPFSSCGLATAFDTLVFFGTNTAIETLSLEDVVISESAFAGIKTLKEVVKDSYEFCIQKVYAHPSDYNNTTLPTAEMIAEDIANNYEGYDIIPDTPSAFNIWVSEVKQELNRQNLDFAEEVE